MSAHISTLSKAIILFRRRTRKRTIAPQLPPELLTLILEPAWQGIQKAIEELIFSPVVREYLPLSRRPARSIVSIARSALVRLAHVCRAWYEACTVLLYSRTILFSPRQLAHFRRTVEGSPSLAGLVKELSILIPKRDSLLPVPLPVKEFDIVGATLSIFKACSSAEAVAIYSPDYTDDMEPSVGTFPASTVLPAGIRSLSLHSLVFESYYFPVQSLINLEVLCLNRYTFRLICGIPHLPLLNTLKIRGAKWWPDLHPIPDIISAERFPSLQCLYMYLNRFYLPRDGVTKKAEIPLLKTLHVIGEKEVKAFDALVEYGYLGALQHLCIGSFSRKDHPFSTWVYPRTLQTLTVFVNTKNIKASQKVLLDSLSLNNTLQRSGAAYPSLTRVVINVFSQTRFLAEDDEVGKRVEFEAIWEACDDFGVEAELKIIDLNEWTIQHGELLPKSPYGPGV